MQIIRSVNELVDFIAKEKNHKRSVGLVPTMGALHAGHLSLVERSLADNDTTVVSVFVNPTQFNNPADLASYPRTEENDVKLLAAAGTTAVFMPTVEEIYPQGTDAEPTHVFNLGSAAEVMEGKYRPGHFQGVARIVSRLFELVNPNRAYFGEKDFQQIAVIRAMVESEGIDVEIIDCPIKRSDDGLALSSRNALLTDDQRRNAPRIYDVLTRSLHYATEHTVEETRNFVISNLDMVPEMKVEYYEIVDSRTLLPVEDWNEAPGIVGCITVYNGQVRLIDNIRYK